MAWDGLIMRFGDVAEFEDLPKDFVAPPLASSPQLRDLLVALFPSGEHASERSTVCGDRYWIELNHGCHTSADQEVSAIGVRSNAGPGASEQLQRLCESLGARLLDIQFMRFADFARGTAASMSSFAAWRDRVIQEGGAGE